MIDILSVFSRTKAERFKIFFIGESVSILPEYYSVTNSSKFETPIYGWTIRNISGSTATIVRGVLHNTHKLHIDCKYLKSE
jgi:hypothetical protein